MNCLEIVYTHFHQYVDRRLSYHCDMLTRGMGGVEMESKKEEEWETQLQCWSLQLINCFAFKPEFLSAVCKPEFLSKLPGIRGPVANCPRVIEALCNIARSSDDWQYMVVDCLLWLLQDKSTCHKVFEKALHVLLDLSEISTLGDHNKLGDSIVSALPECVVHFTSAASRSSLSMSDHMKEEIEEVLNAKQRLKLEKNMSKEDLHIKGLSYLHEDCEVKIVHCDIKPEH
ncbi:G-type lectin S-receptor-like serine/threonine-protein kinase SD2-5, partial [Bienertia sinuspersici]